MNFIHFFKFGLVGFTGLIVDFGVTWIAKEKLKINKYISNGFGFVFGVTNNYILNRYFTFQNENPNIGWQFISFFIIAIIGFLISTNILYILQNKTKLNFYLSKFVATLVVFLWNFGINSIYTFK